MQDEIATRTRMRPADAAAIADASACLRAGGLVAFPTETVYGLGADATSGDAVARLYTAKGRPAFNPLIAHVASMEAARVLGRFDASAEGLAAAFWPGPLTLVLPKAPTCRISELATAGLDTIAIRVPSHPVALALLQACGHPVAAPSANRSGHVSPTLAAHVRADLEGRIDLILDGGPTNLGLESTVVACLGDAAHLLRPGGLAREHIERFLGRPLPHDNGFDAGSDGDAPLAPGMLPSHYAPKTRLRMNAMTVQPGEALLAFGPALADGFENAVAIATLSRSGDLVEAATQLFAQLRMLDAVGAAIIAVMPVPTEGLGEAINDRLRRAAAPR